MSTIFVVVPDKRAEQPFQMRFIDCNHMIQQFPTATADPSLGDTILPRTTHGSPHGMDAHGTNGRRNFGAVLGVVIQDQKLSNWFVGEGFA